MLIKDIFNFNRYFRNINSILLHILDYKDYEVIIIYSKFLSMYYIET